jgi:hypothetical protein
MHKSIPRLPRDNLPDSRALAMPCEANVRRVHLQVSTGLAANSHAQP